MLDHEGVTLHGPAADLQARLRPFSVLDVRDDSAFAGGHLPGSGHVPLAKLRERRAELPPRDAPILVVGEDGAGARMAAERLQALGYPRVAWLDQAPSTIEGGISERGPAARLWRPSPFLEQVVDVLPDPRNGRDRVLDLAAGAGRESVFLALRGYQVEAWDHDRMVLERAAAMARRHGVAIATCTRDLETRDPHLPVEAHDVVMVFRFLHRPLFPQIARAVAPGGHLVYETYLRGQERFGRPKHPRFLLFPGELPQLLPGFEVLRYEESTPECGPFLARLLGRRSS